MYAHIHVYQTYFQSLTVPVVQDLTVELICHQRKFRFVYYIFVVLFLVISCSDFYCFFVELNALLCPFSSTACHEISLNFVLTVFMSVK